MSPTSKSQFSKIRDNRLKWFGIDPMEQNEAEELKDIYEKDCKCDFDEDIFRCKCGWNENITHQEHKSFQEIRITSKLGIHEPYALRLMHQGSTRTTFSK